MDLCMPRRRRSAPGGLVYHVCNRGSRKGELFRGPADYSEFTRLSAEARYVRDMRIIAYCLMPNHWHFVVYPSADGQVTAFFRWLAHTHAMRAIAHRRVMGLGPL